MRIAVCLSRVPDPKTVEADPITGEIDAGRTLYVLNPADAAALEIALRLKAPGDKVTALTVGPDEAESVLREALAVGADDVFRVWEEDRVKTRPLVTSLLIATALRTEGPLDLVICGARTADDEVQRPLGPQGRGDEERGYQRPGFHPVLLPDAENVVGTDRKGFPQHRFGLIWADGQGRDLVARCLQPQRNLQRGRVRRVEDVQRPAGVDLAGDRIGLDRFRVGHAGKTDGDPHHGLHFGGARLAAPPRRAVDVTTPETSRRNHPVDSSIRSPLPRCRRNSTSHTRNTAHS